VIEPPDLRPLVDELVRDGAGVVWLAGSYARGDAGPYSDLDIGALTDGNKRGRSFRLYAGMLTSIVWTTADATRASFRDPSQIGGSVPGWRSAVLLHDPYEAGNKLREEALAWTWDEVSGSCDRWVVGQFLQLCEEVHKLLNAIAGGHEMNAAVRRSVLAQRLPLVLSVHRRILYDSETRLWDAVADTLGAEWRACQTATLGFGGQSLAGSLAAALRLYEMAADELRPVFAADQLAVVAKTLERLGEVRVLRLNPAAP
jgi:predicted nucleotidyltransferase